MSKSATLFDPDAAATLELQAAARFSPQGIVSRAVLARPGLRVTLFGFAAGQELTEHMSSSRALIQILTGSSEWTIDGRPRLVHAGELLHLPPNVPHAVRAEEPFSMLLTLVREVNAKPESPVEASRPDSEAHSPATERFARSPTFSRQHFKPTRT